jgi:hypothetical protein
VSDEGLFLRDGEDRRLRPQDARPAAGALAHLDLPARAQMEQVSFGCAEEGAANFSNPCASAERRLATIAYDAQSRRQSVSCANGSAALFGYSARGDIRCHDINLTGAAASACNGAGAEVAYDFTSNGVSRVLSESLTSTLVGEGLVWSPHPTERPKWPIRSISMKAWTVRRSAMTRKSGASAYGAPWT